MQPTAKEFRQIDHNRFVFYFNKGEHVPYLDEASEILNRDIHTASICNWESDHGFREAIYFARD